MNLLGKTAEGASVYIDYSHTPEALEAALLSLRPYVTGELVLLFGCGGDRDKSKRPLMAKVAAEFADKQIITDDNPRTEDPEAIRKTLALHCPDGLEIPAREEAILQGVKMLGPEDALLISGRGHERYQYVGTSKRPFEDRAHAQQALKNNGGKCV